MKPQEFLKSPFENVLNLLNVIPQGHEKALKHALYNAIATFFLVVGIAAAFGLFYILEPFVKPLIWALLVGSVLHPFKRSLEKWFESWLGHLDSSSQPLILALVMIPINVIDDISEIVGKTIRKYLEWMVGLCLLVLLIFIIYTYTPHAFLSAVYFIWNLNTNILLWWLHNITPTMFISMSCLYIGSLVFFWSNKKLGYFKAVSYIFWFFSALFLARTIGIFTIPMFIILNFCFIGGFAYEVQAIYDSSDEKSYWSAIKNAICDEMSDGPGGKVDEVPEKEDINDPIKAELKKENLHMPGLVITTPGSSRKSDPELYAVGKARFENTNYYSENTESAESSKYIYGVIWACGLILLWRYIWLVHLLPIPIAIYLAKIIGYYFGVWAVLLNQYNALFESLKNWIAVRQIAIFPAPIIGISKLGRLFRSKLMSGIRDAISSFASTIVIFALILFTVCFTLFLVLKIYAEGIHLLAVGASVINSTVVHNPEFLQLLPEGWNDKMETMLNNAYIYGREGISKQLRNMLKDVDPSKVAELEKHALEFWDRVYQAWLMTTMEASPSIGPNVSTAAVAASWHNFLEIIQKTPGVLNMGLVTEFLKDNLETLFSLLESVWALLKGNVSLVFHFFFAAVSVLLGGGSAVLNFLLNGIVFFTALFYLLSSSGDLYKPVDVLTNFSPGNGSKVGKAFESAVNGVFKASFKMALFYGLWTWLIHNIFQVRIIYLPSVLAAMLGAVPFLGTYWASIPAVLELWLAQGQGMLALALFVFQCLPMSFVDTAIYLEIGGGGHPYMTGLAIAGGVFCMGIQGAIFGPLLLCCLLVALNMSSSLMKESPSDTNIPGFSMRQLRSSLVFAWLLMALYIITGLLRNEPNVYQSL